MIFPAKKEIRRIAQHMNISEACAQLALYNTGHKNIEVIPSQPKKIDIEEKIKKNIKLVDYFMKFVHGVTPDNRDDVYQAGLIGLWQAIKTFDESRNCKFSSYAGVCIKREMYKATNDNSEGKQILSLDNMETESPSDYASLSVKEPQMLVADGEKTISLMKRIAAGQRSVKDKKSIIALIMYYQGYPCAQIANELKISERSCRTFWANGRSLLKNHPNFRHAAAEFWDGVEENEYSITLQGIPFQVRFSAHIFIDLPAKKMQQYEEDFCKMITRDDVADWLLNNVRIGDSICLYYEKTRCTTMLTMGKDTIEISFVTQTPNSRRKAA